MFPTKMQNVQVRRKTPWVKDGGAFVPLWVQDANVGKEKRWTLKMQKELQALHENAQRFTSSEVAEKSRSLSRDPERASVTILNKLTMKTWKSALPNHCKSHFNENRVGHCIGTETWKISLNGGFEKSKVRSWIRHGVPHCRGLAPFQSPPIMWSLQTQWLIQFVSARSLSCNCFVSKVNLRLWVEDKAWFWYLHGTIWSIVTDRWIFSWRVDE